MNPRVAAVVVTYHPGVSFPNTLASISPQVSQVYVINNTPSSLNKYQSPGVVVVDLCANYGIAAAQNIGIALALAAGYSYILLSDQDTIYPRNYIFRMYKLLAECGPSVLAIAPTFFDNTSDAPAPLIAPSRVWGFAKFNSNSGLNVLAHAIASGLLIRASAFSLVGYMNNSLFIDWVDLEWCWRLRRSGYRIVGTSHLTINHHLGDHSRNLGFRKVPLRNPTRHYYITRNAFYLSLYSSSLHPVHRFILFLRSLRYILAFPLLAKPRLKNLRVVTLAFIHGISNNTSRNGSAF